MPASPSTDNLYLGKGVVTVDGRDVGNVPEISIGSDTTYLDHFSSRTGIRYKDRSVATETSVTLNMLLEEVTPDNARLFFLGGAGATSFEIFKNTEVVAAVTFTGENSVGQKITLSLSRVALKPNGEFQLITEDWGSFPITGDVLLSEASDPSYGTISFEDVA